MTSTEKIKLTDIIGSRGKYQTVLYIISFFSSWFIGTAVVTVEILAPIVTIYWDWDADNPNRTTFLSNHCQMEDILRLNRSSNFSNSNSKLIYESQYSRRTLTEELDMVCERSWLVSFGNFMCMMGLCAGHILLRLSEKYGRRPFIVLTAVSCVVLALCMSFTRGYVMFAICSFLYRASTNQACTLLFIQAVEIASPALTPYVSLFMKSGLLIAQTIFVCAAWILKDWFHIQLFQTALVALYLPVIWYVLESPIWLAVRGRYEEARQVLIQIVKRNGRSLQEAEPKIDAWLDQMKIRCEVETIAEKGKVTDLFKNRTIFLYTCGLTYTMIATTFVYAGQVMNAESFGSGLYLDLTLSNSFSLVSVLLAAISLRRISTRVMLGFSFLLEGLSCVAYPITYGFPLARTIISILGRLFISPIFAISMVYMNEVYPTSVRGVGTGFSGIISYLISSASPFTKELGERTSMYVPFVLFTVLSLTSALVYKLMPETKGKPMVHTVHELKREKGISSSPVMITSLNMQHK